MTRSSSLLGYSPSEGVRKRIGGALNRTTGSNMTSKIEIEKIGDEEFQVLVTEGQSSTSHRVTLKRTDYQRLAAGAIEPGEVVRRSFEFLLENEPKESILARFDLTVIGRYFPNFEREIRRRISNKTESR